MRDSPLSVIDTRALLNQLGLIGKHFSESLIKRREQTASTSSESREVGVGDLPMANNMSEVRCRVRD